MTLSLLASAKMTTLSLQNGNSEMSPFGYVAYGIITNSLLQDASQAYQFGHMAVRLCDRFDNADVRGMTNFLFAADVQSWKRPVREADRYYENAYKYGMDAGNWLTVSFMTIQSGSDRLTYGKNLEELYTIVRAHTEFLQQIKSLENLDALTVGVLQPVRQLLGLTPSCFSFDDDRFSEAEYLEKYQNTPYHLAWFYSVKIRHAYLFEQVTEYPELISKLEIIESATPSHAKLPSTTFYVLLMHLTLIEKNNNETQIPRHWQEIEILEEKLGRWQQDCPENIVHKCLLVRAEKARLQGDKATAIDCYEQSITRAISQEYQYEAALANECAAKFYLNWGKNKVAGGYMQEAYYSYAQWGAKAKIDDLEGRYPQLLYPILAPQTSSISLSTTISNQKTSNLFGTFTRISDVLDLASLLKASRTLSREIELEKLLSTLMRTILENAGATKGALLLTNEMGLTIEAIVTHTDTKQELKFNSLHQSIPLDDYPDLPAGLINYVRRTTETILLDAKTAQTQFANNAYLLHHSPQSLLCFPLLERGNLIGVLYLENDLTSDAFTKERVDLLDALCAQAAISLTNARLYEQAQQALSDLQQAQLQLVQNEKMATLGNLVAGVAHEINNPVGFIGGNVRAAQEYLQDLLYAIELYQQKYPSPDAELAEELEDLDLDFIAKDFPKLISSMQSGCDRISNISISLRTFSRADADKKTEFNLHDGIDSTLLILKYRLKANEERPAIEIVKNYGNLPEVKCYAGQINQVFMNLLANAIDALDESNEGKSFTEIENEPNRITIATELSEDNQNAIVQISDNGTGIPDHVKEKIFNQGFTTKEVGKGTGLGMAIAQSIVTEKHGGAIDCQSELGKGTGFIISLPIS